MGAYLDKIKASNPDAYQKIVQFGQHQADANQGGTVGDWQAQLLTNLDTSQLNAPKTIPWNYSLAPTYNNDPENAYFTGMGQVQETPSGFTPIMVYDESGSNGQSIGGYTKSLGNINGLPIDAKYDASGNLTGYVPHGTQMNWLDANNYVTSEWDPTGKVTPTQGYHHTGSGGGMLGDIANTLGPIGMLAAAYFGGPAIAEGLGLTGATELAGATDLAGAAPDFTTQAAGYGGAADTSGLIAGGGIPNVPNIGSLPNFGQGTQLATASTAPADTLGALNANNAAPADSNFLSGMADVNATEGAGVSGTGILTNANPASTGFSLSNLIPSTPAGQIAAAQGLASLGSGLLGANAAQNAANTQSQAAQSAIAQQQQMFNTINAQQAPYRAAGYGALNKIAQLGGGGAQQYDAQGNPIGATTGATDYLTHQFNASDLAAGLAPNYDFMLQQGQMANQRAANAGGGGIGGNALQGLNQFTQNYAGNAYQNAFNNYQTQRGNIYNTLASIAGIGQTGQNATNTAAQNATNAQTQLGVGSAAAQAAGQVGTANAASNALGGIAGGLTLASLLNQRGNAVTPVQG